MKANLIEIFNSIQGEGGSVPGSCFGKRQVFIRFAGCNLKCKWCDTASSRIAQRKFMIETVPSSGKMKEYESINPIHEDVIADIMNGLWTNDTHSLSLTGGEPMLQEDFIVEFCQDWNSLRPIYLETAGYVGNSERIAPFITYACVDIKDKSSNKKFETNYGYKEWFKLLEKEFEFLYEFKRADVKVFAKYVVTNETIDENVEMIIKRIRQLEVPIVIQPVTPIGGAKQPTLQQLFKWFEICGKYLDKNMYSLSLQTHKYLNLL